MINECKLKASHIFLSTNLLCMKYKCLSKDDDEHCKMALNNKKHQYNEQDFKRKEDIFSQMFTGCQHFSSY